MIKAFYDMPTFSGKFTDELEEKIEALETIADVPII